MDEVDEGFTPKRDSPKSFDCFGGCIPAISLGVVALLCLLATSVILTPRRTLTLPSFRLHVFRRQVSTYSRLSWPGKSGSSPFNCSNTIIRSLQTLHFASAADGGEFGSIQVLHINQLLSQRAYNVDLGDLNFEHTGRPPSWLISSSFDSAEAYPRRTLVNV